MLHGTSDPAFRRGEAVLVEVEEGVAQRHLGQARGREAQVRLVEHRVQAFARVVEASLALAHDGQVDRVGGDAVRVLEGLREAQRLAVAARRALELAVAHVRLALAIGFDGRFLPRRGRVFDGLASAP